MLHLPFDKYINNRFKARIYNQKVPRYLIWKHYYLIVLFFVYNHAAIKSKTSSAELQRCKFVACMFSQMFTIQTHREITFFLAMWLQIKLWELLYGFMLCIKIISSPNNVVERLLCFSVVHKYNYYFCYRFLRKV